MKGRETKLQAETIANTDLQGDGDEMSMLIFNNQNEALAFSRDLLEQPWEGDINFSDSLENSFFQTFVVNSQQPIATQSAPPNVSSYAAISNELANQKAQFESIQNVGLESNNFDGLDEMSNISKKESLEQTKPMRFYLSQFNKNNVVREDLANNLTHEGEYDTPTCKFFIEFAGVKTRVYSESQVDNSILFHVDNVVKRKSNYQKILEKQAKHSGIRNNQPTLVYSNAQAYKLQTERNLQAISFQSNVQTKIDTNTKKRNIQHVQAETPFENPFKKKRL